MEKREREIERQHEKQATVEKEIRCPTRPNHILFSPNPKRRFIGILFSLDEALRVETQTIPTRQARSFVRWTSIKSRRET